VIKKLVSVAIVCVMLLTIGSCSFYVSNLEIRNVRLFIAGDFRDAYLLEFVDGNVFNITAFDGVRVPVNTQEDLLYDFFATPTMMHSRLVASRNSGLEQGYLRRIRDEGTIELSRRQSDTIQRLIRDVARGEADTEFYGSPEQIIAGNHLWIWMIIDGEMYWSLYSNDINAAQRHPEHSFVSRYFNRNLLLLAYELINLSPIDLRLQTP